MKKLLVLIAFSAVLVAAVLAVQGRGVQACCPPPPNDNFGGATVISAVPYTDTTTNTSDATSAPNDPSMCRPYGHSVWYQFTTPDFPQTFGVDTNDSGYDTVLAIYTGAKGSLNLVACDDDSGNGYASALKVGLLPGTTYHFLVGSFGTDSGGSLIFNLACQTNCQLPNLFEDSAKCYQVKFAKSSFRFPPQEILTYDLNFELGTPTTVLGLSLFCTPVLQTLNAGEEAPLEVIRRTCYNVRDKFEHANQNVFVQTKVSESVLTVGKALSICVLAVKTRGLLPDFPEGAGTVLKCYSARLAKGSPRFQTVNGTVVDQFSTKLGKRTTILRPVSFCNFSEKLVACPGLDPCPAGAPGSSGAEPNSIVCYAVRQASFRPFNIPVIDQFIDQQFDADDPLLTVKKADSLCVLATKKKPAPNDTIQNATEVHTRADCVQPSCAFENHIGTTNATTARNDPRVNHCQVLSDGFSYGHSVWYTYTPGATHVEIDTLGSTYDTVLVIYTGQKGSLTQIACDDDGGSGDSSFLKLSLNAGTKYTILVGAKGNSLGGKLKFHVLEQDSCSSGNVYTNNFGSAAGAAWSNTSLDTTPFGSRQFLGQFGNQTVSLSLSSLPAHTSLTLCLDMFAIRSWDGNNAEFGPDVWDLSVSSGPTLLHTTFSNLDEAPYLQNFPDSYPGAKHPPYFGAVEVDSLGYNDFYGSAVYHFVFTIPHTASTVQFNFSASGLQPSYDESWGLDDVGVAAN